LALGLKPQVFAHFLEGDLELPPKKRTQEMSGKLEPGKGKNNAEKSVQ
jgi:hypothetical protein